MIEKYRVNFKGTWSTIQKAWVMLGIDAVGRAHARNMKGTSASEAFKAVYGIKDGRTMDMEMGDCGPRNGKGGCGSPAAGSFTWGSREIEFADGAPFSGPGPNRSARLASEMNIHQVVHELGHAFAARFTNDNPSNPYHLLEEENDSLTHSGMHLQMNRGDQIKKRLHMKPGRTCIWAGPMGNGEVVTMQTIALNSWAIWLSWRL